MGIKRRVVPRVASPGTASAYGFAGSGLVLARFGPAGPRSVLAGRPMGLVAGTRVVVGPLLDQTHPTPRLRVVQVALLA
jgi:hypothetical protein